MSVVIAVKNAAAYFAECLDSVAAQTFVNVEVVVVDGGSTDETVEIAKSYRGVRLLRQTRTGLWNAWNYGIRRSRGSLIAFLDSDDRWTPNKLAAQVAMLNDRPDLEGVIGKVRFFVEPGTTPPRSFRTRVLGADHVAPMPGALLARRRLFDRVGHWRENWVTASDIDWFLRLSDSGTPIGVVDEVVILKRVHDRNLSSLLAADAVYPRELLRLLHASILRKRRARPEHRE